MTPHPPDRLPATHQHVVFVEPKLVAIRHVSCPPTPSRQPLLDNAPPPECMLTRAAPCPNPSSSPAAYLLALWPHTQAVALSKASKDLPTFDNVSPRGESAMSVPSPASAPAPLPARSH